MSSSVHASNKLASECDGSAGSDEARGSDNPRRSDESGEGRVDGERVLGGHVVHGSGLSEGGSGSGETGGLSRELDVASRANFSRRSDDATGCVNSEGDLTRGWGLEPLGSAGGDSNKSKNLIRREKERAVMKRKRVVRMIGIYYCIEVSILY